MIDIYSTNGSFYVWNAQDAIRVRQEFRVIGTLVGCLPRLPRQNIHLGLPLQLSSFEVRLLLEKGFARLCEDADQLVLPSSEDVEAFKFSRQQNYAEQLEACKVEKQKTMLSNLDRIVFGKKRKMKTLSNPEKAVAVGKKKMKKLMRRQLAAGRDASANESDEEEIREQVQQQICDLSIPVSLPDKAVCIQIHTANCQQKSSGIHATTEWKFETNPIEVMRYRVFTHFWEMGYFLTSGGKFGGDFLIYPGDPSRYHSFYIAVCVPNDRLLPALEIVALGRLGTGVKKTVLLCSVDDSGKVCYTSLQWSGIN